MAKRTSVASAPASTSTAVSAARPACGAVAARVTNAPLVIASDVPNARSPAAWSRVRLRAERTPKVKRRLAAVLATAVSSSATALARRAPAEPRSSAKSTT